MNKNLNEWYIGAGITPIIEGQLSKRWEGVKEFSDNVSVDDIINLVKMFFKIPVDENFTISFANSFVKHDDSFSRKSINELSLLSGVVLLEIAQKNGDYYSFVELLTLVASFGRQNPVVPEILDEIQTEFKKDSDAIRKPERKVDKKISIPQNDKLLETLDETWTTEAIEEFTIYTNQVKTTFEALNDVISELKNAQKIRFEESQLLWWLTTAWSNTRECSFKTMDKHSNCLIIGYEAAELIEVFPGPFSIKGILSKILEACKGPKTTLLFYDLIQSVNNQCLSKHILTRGNSNMVTLLPITEALIYAENTSTTAEWLGKYTKEIYVNVTEIKLSPLEYANQFYYEILAQRCYFDLTNE